MFDSHSTRLYQRPVGSSDCTLSFLVARTDIKHMMLTIPHLVRACNFPFAERMLTVDVSPLLGSFAARPGVGTLDELKACCSKLVKDNVIDTVVEIDNSEQCRRNIFKKHIRGYTRQAKDSRGSAVLGYLFGIEQAKTRYLLHFDSDMLLFQRPGSSWVAHGIRLLDQNPDVMCVLPLAGPPSADGTLEQSEPYQHDPRGIFTFKSFTSRKYLIDVERFCKLLPVDALWRSFTKRVREYLTNRSGLTTWERMVSGKLRKSGYIRADIDSPDAWTLHSRDRGELYCRYLPDIIAAVERGEYPAENAGKYDLNLKAYIQLVESKRRG